MILFLLIIFVSSTNGLNCTGNFSYGYTKNVQTIPANLSQFATVVGNFSNTAWYNFVVNSTTGTNNQINSTRTITDINLGLVTQETLIDYQLSDKHFEISWLGPGDQIQMNFNNFTLSNYSETLRGDSICNGAGVNIVFDIQFCASNFRAAADALTERHRVDIENIEIILGTTNITKCRTNGSLKKSNNFFIGFLYIFIFILF